MTMDFFFATRNVKPGPTSLGGSHPDTRQYSYKLSRMRLRQSQEITFYLRYLLAFPRSALPRASVLEL